MKNFFKKQVSKFLQKIKRTKFYFDMETLR